MLTRLITTTVTFIALDLLWLGVVAKQWYINAFGSMLRLENGGISPIWAAAVVVYIALISGIMLFVLPKAQGSVMAALGWGVVFGLVTYGTYDFTNLAVMANWPVRICIIDTIWGGVICGLTSMMAVYIGG